MLAVPFENLDISLGRKIICDESRFLHKIVNERRGGFCYEMNGAFAELLRALGFKVTLLSARVSGGDGSEGPEFDHLALRVDLDQPWLADVGFGDSFVEPLLLEPGLEQAQIRQMLSTYFRARRIVPRSEYRWRVASAIRVHAGTSATLRVCSDVSLPSDFARFAIHAQAGLFAGYA
jgi:arylamine N-acetyltransferase